MNILTLDFETYFADDYTLSKLTTEAYIRDDRFEALGVGVRFADGSSEWVRGPEIEGLFLSIDWKNTAVLAHHAHFDGLILSHHYGIKPALWLDTLSMARLMLGNHLSVALGSLAAHYGLAAKTLDYSSATGFKGKRACNLTAADWTMLGDGCLHDCELTLEIFQRLAKAFPKEEYRIIDYTVRMFTEPKLVGDQALFEQVRDTEFMRKAEALLALGVSKADLQSSAKFCALLEREGVEIEYKEGSNGPLAAIAKTDDFMKGLAEDDGRVGLLAQARLEGKSTIDETRGGRLAGMAGRGALPVYLGYCAAHTTRWGGGDKVNFQNFKRGGDLRRGLCAPRGYLLAVADKSQIECRLLNYAAGQHDVIETFRNHADPYVGGASAFYGRTITKADKLERGLGKVLELACGYGMGAARFQATCKQGPMGAPPILLDELDAKRAITVYRDSHAQVVELWREADGWLDMLGSDEACRVDLPEVSCRIEGHSVILPNGAPMHYPLEWRSDESGRGAWHRKTRRGWSKIWGGHLVENVIQALSRVDISQTMLRIEKVLGREIGRPIGTTHDEIWYLLPESEAHVIFDEVILTEMRRSPDWMPDVPLDAEGFVGDRYDK